MFTRIVLLGLPGTEVQTLARQLSESLNLPLLLIDQTVDTDGRSLAIIRQQLNDSASFILTGFPDTVPQAQALDRMLTWQGSPVELAVVINDEQHESPKVNSMNDEHLLAATVKQFVRLKRYYRTQNKLHLINSIGDADADLILLQTALKTRSRHSQI